MNNKDNKKKSNPGAGIAVVVFLIAFLSRMSSTEGLGRAIYEWGDRFFGSGSVIGILVAVVVSAVFIIAAIKAAVRSAKRENNTFAAETTRKTSAPLHSHDRLSGYTDGSCGDEEHWRKQLDGFLAAGIIDRSEYKVLLEKRKTSYSRRT